MKIARTAARLGAAALTVLTVGSMVVAAAPPAGALTATHLDVQVLGIDLSTKLWLKDQTLQVRVTAKDGSNNVDTLYGGAVSLVLSNGDVAPAAYTFIPIADAGVHTFNVTLSTLGMGVTIGATDGTLPSAMSPDHVNVAPKLVVSGISTPLVVNSQPTVRVTAKNFDDSQTVSAYRGTVHFTSTGGTNLPADYAFVAGDTGVHDFVTGVKFPTAGINRSVTATDIATAATGSQSGITVLPKLSVATDVVAPITTGTTANVTVTALDGNDTTYTGYTGTVHFTSTDAQANLPTNYVFQVADNGTKTFTAKLNTPGAQRVSANDTTNPTQTNGTSGAMSVVPLLAVSGIPNPMTAGTVSDVTVTSKAFDNAGALQTFAGYTGMIHFTSNDPSGATLLPPDTSFAPGDNGVHVFASGVKLITPGVRTVTATDTLQPLTTGTQAGIAVNAGMSVLFAKDPVDLDDPGDVTVKAIDGAGATLTSYTGTVHFTSSDTGPGTTLPADYTFLAGDNGQHVFANGVKFHTGGDQSLTVTDTVTPSITGSQGLITVTPKFTVTGIPNPSFRTVASPVTVKAVNFDGSTVTNYKGTVRFLHFAGNDPTDTFPADYTFTTGTGADNGIHTFLNAVSLMTTGLHDVKVQDLAATLPATSGSQLAISVVDAIVTTTTGATDVAGTSHAVTATVNDGAGHNIPDGTTVHFVANTPIGTQTSDVVATAGQAVWSFTSIRAGVSTVTASAGIFSAVGGPKTVTFTPGPISSILLTADPDASVGETTVVTATGFDVNSNPVVDGTPIAFTVDGTGSEFPTSDSTTTTLGSAFFEFFSDDFGVSNVHATSGAVSASPISITWIGGYWVFGANGSVTPSGDASNFGSMVGQKLNGQIIGAARTATGQGYWLVGSDGGIFTFGDAGFFGSTGSQKLNAPVIGMAATPTGNGYWLVAADGGIFTFGDAGFFGSTGSKKLNQPVFAMAPTLSGNGYWLVARDGGIFSFGDAPFYGSTGGTKLNKPIVGATTTLSGAGYWLVAGDGGVFSFGDAPFFGSAGGQASSSPFVGMAPSPTGGGYWILSKNGTVNTYGDAPDYGPGGNNAVAIVPTH